MVNVSLHTSNVYKTNNNISDLNEVNNTNIKEWRISLQWLVDVAKLDLTTPGQIEPMQGQIEPNIGKFRKTHNTISLRQGTFGAHLWLAIILSAILDVSHYKDHKIAIKTLQLKIRTWNKNEHPQVGWSFTFIFTFTCWPSWMVSITKNQKIGCHGCTIKEIWKKTQCKIELSRWKVRFNPCKVRFNSHKVRFKSWVLSQGMTNWFKIGLDHTKLDLESKSYKVRFNSCKVTFYHMKLHLTNAKLDWIHSKLGKLGLTLVKLNSSHTRSDSNHVRSFKIDPNLVAQGFHCKSLSLTVEPLQPFCVFW